MALGFDDVRVGVWTHPDGHTGCAVVLPPPGSLGATAVRGGAPGTREAAALGPVGQGQECHAIFLSGGSAFGLAVGDGVALWCEEQGIGYRDRFVTTVPVVGGAIVFDLHRKDAPRPDAAAGRAACEAATTADPPMGVVGPGAGCTAAKTHGFAHVRRGGLGWAVATGGGATVGALLAVNPVGNVLAEDGTILVGPPGMDTGAPSGYPYEPMKPLGEREAADAHGANTIIGCLVTDVVLTKSQACRAVDLAHTGIARAVDPPHTTMDGDALFLLTTQRAEVAAPVDLTAALGAKAVAAGIRAAVRASAHVPLEISEELR